MIITTSYQPTAEMIDRAKRIANQWGFPFVPRRKDSLSALMDRHKASSIWIVTKTGLEYMRQDDQTPIFFHPSMALLRVKRLLSGEKDTLIECSGFEAGDSLLDCTAGMGSDAMVFAFVGGAQSRIIAIESERVPYILLSEGLTYYDTEINSLNEAMRRIQVVHSDHLTYLQQLPNDSIDIVYFDPMFRNPVEQSPGISPLRHFVNDQPVQTVAIQEAKRVARKAIVLKERKGSPEFARLGFSDVQVSSSKIAYGVIRI